MCAGARANKRYKTIDIVRLGCPTCFGTTIVKRAECVFLPVCSLIYMIPISRLISTKWSLEVPGCSALRVSEIPGGLKPGATHISIMPGFTLCGRPLPDERQEVWFEPINSKTARDKWGEIRSLSSNPYKSMTRSSTAWLNVKIFERGSAFKDGSRAIRESEYFDSAAY